MMATTSTELGGLFGRHQGHKIAQGYGMFLWAAVLLYAVTAWRVCAERGSGREGETRRRSGRCRRRTSRRGGALPPGDRRRPGDETAGPPGFGFEETSGEHGDESGLAADTD